MGVDDLAALFDEPAPGPSQDVRFRQGVVVAFNAVTLQNTVVVGGTAMFDLPLLGVGEATLLVPGAVVGILTVGDASKTMYITGRIVTPNTPDATDATALLNSLVYAASIAAQETSTSTTFGDLATFGPEVTVPVRGPGRLLILLTSQIQWVSTAFAASAAAGGWVTVEMSGANVIAPLTANDKLLPTFNVTTTVTTGTVANACQVAATAAAVFDGLAPGSTTVTMKYACQFAGQDVDFGRRTLTVITL